MWVVRGWVKNKLNHTIVWDLELLTSLIIGKDFISYPQIILFCCLNKRSLRGPDFGPLIFFVSHIRLKNKQVFMVSLQEHSKQNTAGKFTWKTDRRYA